MLVHLGPCPTVTQEPVYKNQSCFLISRTSTSSSLWPRHLVIQDKFIEIICFVILFHLYLTRLVGWEPFLPVPTVTPAQTTNPIRHRNNCAINFNSGRTDVDDAAWRPLQSGLRVGNTWKQHSNLSWCFSRKPTTRVPTTVSCCIDDSERFAFNCRNAL